MNNHALTNPASTRSKISYCHIVYNYTKSPRWSVSWSRDAGSQKRQSKACLSRQFSRELRRKTARTPPTQARSFRPVWIGLLILVYQLKDNKRRIKQKILYFGSEIEVKRTKLEPYWMVNLIYYRCVHSITNHVNYYHRLFLKKIHLLIWSVQNSTIK